MFFRKSLIAVDSTVSHPHRLDHITDPVPGGSMSPINKLAFAPLPSLFHTVFAPLPSLLPVPLHRPEIGDGIYPDSLARQKPPPVLSSVDIQVIMIHK